MRSETVKTATIKYSFDTGYLFFFIKLLVKLNFGLNSIFISMF